MSDSITQSQFLALFKQLAGDDAAQLVAELIIRHGWEDKDAYVQDDVATVMGWLTQLAREEILPQLDEASPTHAHTAAMLDMVEQHALPVMHDRAEK